MDTVSRKVRVFEQHKIPTEGNDILFAELMFPKPPMRPRRVVFIPPLVGAGPAQAMTIFRNFARRGSILISFEYRGHPRSTGTFELDKTIIDTRHALIWAWNYANDRGLPLHGFTTCYGVIPLMAQFADQGCGQVLRSITTISGLFRLDQFLHIDEFAQVVSRHLGEELSGAAILARLAAGTIDCDGDAFREALRQYSSAVLPERRLGRDNFEVLQYDRVNIPGTIRQLAEARYLDGIDVPRWLPCNVIYGRADTTLTLHTAEGREAYRNLVLSLIPHAVLHECDFDHFGRGADHDAAIERAGDVFERYDSSPIPVPHLKMNFEPKGVFA